MKQLIEFIFFWGAIGVLAAFVYAMCKNAKNTSEAENSPEFQERINHLIDNDKNL